MDRTECLQILKTYHQRGLSLIPLKPKSKIPMVKWKKYHLTNEALLRYLAQDTNWAIRCDESFHALDFDDTETYERFIRGDGQVLRNAPTIRTNRGYHVWFKPRKPVSSYSKDGIEVKGMGSLIIIPPSIHPNGSEYYFKTPLNGNLATVDIEELLGPDIIRQGISRKTQKESVNGNTPSDFALRYGKSPYPQSLCGKATKIFTRSDGEAKCLLSLRCWKWHCPRCASLLKRYWQDKLEDISFRFILRLPNVTKPNTFLRHLGKPDYVHIVANGESWLFLADGETEKVWIEAKEAGYELIAGDAGGDPTVEDASGYLQQALCFEEEPLNIKRKISHSRGLFKKACPNNMGNESKPKDDDTKEDEDMSAAPDKEHPTWNSEVVMKPIEEIARELEVEGWQILWKSEVEAIAVKNKVSGAKDMDIVELMENLGIKLKKTGKEYVGLCPFHDDRNPSLSINREKGIWHCFGCGRGGDVHKFIAEWQACVRD